MFILNKGHQPGVYVPLRALFLVSSEKHFQMLLAVNKDEIYSPHHALGHI